MKRKQKEILKRTKKESEYHSSGPHRDIYLGTPSSWERARKRQQQDAFAWKVGIFAITVISIVGIYAIWWAANL